MSVRSVFDGNLTLNNLNVTTINGLPPSGNVVQVVDVIAPPLNTTVPVISGVTANVGSITLGAGTWRIDLALFIELGNTTANGDLLMSLITGSDTVFFKTQFPAKSTSSVPIELNTFDSVMVTIATSNTYNLSFTFSFTGGSCIYASPLPPIPTIRATKLA